MWEKEGQRRSVAKAVYRRSVSNSSCRKRKASYIRKMCWNASSDSITWPQLGLWPMTIQNRWVFQGFLKPETVSVHLTAQGKPQSHGLATQKCISSSVFRVLFPEVCITKSILSCDLRVCWEWYGMIRYVGPFPCRHLYTIKRILKLSSAPLAASATQPGEVICGHTFLFHRWIWHLHCVQIEILTWAA